MNIVSIFPWLRALTEGILTHLMCVFTGGFCVGALLSICVALKNHVLVKYIIEMELYEMQ